jgi:hypothetical protein
LRPEIQALRRPVPEDFNEEQQNTFAVFSGSGVIRLKRTLWELTHPTDEIVEAENY